MAEEKLIIDYWDVGQGNGCVIRLPNKKLILIDVGPKGSPILDWLSERPYSIHAVVLTHNDEDHAGCLPSLVRIPGLSVDTIYMLLDRDKKSSKFQNIWRPVRDEEERGRLTVLAASKDTVIWSEKDFCLKILYPSFSENIEAGRPNETSAIVSLFYRSKAMLIWPGDAPMQIIAEKCYGTLPLIFDGPHHGAPVDRKVGKFKEWVDAFLPERIFISVGTSNQHSHPNPHYLLQQAKRGCQVFCSQLTKFCDNIHVNQNQPVLQTAALLGLRPARSGVACRGCFRFTITASGSFFSDPWDAEHIKRVQLLRRPKCLRP